jgi:hypothetical protein
VCYAPFSLPFSHSYSHHNYLLSFLFSLIPFLTRYSIYPEFISSMFHQDPYTFTI